MLERLPSALSPLDQAGDPVTREVWSQHVRGIPVAERFEALVNEREAGWFVRTGFDGIRGISAQSHVAPLLERIRPNLARAIEQGYAPAAARSRIEDSFRDVPVRYINFTNAAGEYYPKWHIATMCWPEVGDESMLAAVATHEVAGHPPAGGTFRRDPVTGKPVRVRIGFHNLRLRQGDQQQTSPAPSPFYRYVALDEAVTEHMESGYLDGDFATVDPDLRAGGEHANGRGYYARRKVLAEAIKRAGGAIDLRVVTRASFEDTDEHSGTFTDRKEMLRQFRTVYGAGSLRELDQLMLKAEEYQQLANAVRMTSDERRAILDRVLACIQPVVRDAEGRVVSGGIDLARAEDSDFIMGPASTSMRS